MTQPTSVFAAGDVEGLEDSLPGRRYKQEPVFWVLVALQDWLRENDNYNLLGYESGNSVRTYAYPTDAAGQRLSPRDVYYLFCKPPPAVAASLPQCFCVAAQDDSPVLVKSFVCRKSKSSERVGQFGLTCASRINQCGYFTWLNDSFENADIEEFAATPAMLAHIRDAAEKDRDRRKALTNKKSNFRQRRASSAAASSSAGYTSTDWESDGAFSQSGHHEVGIASAMPAASGSNAAGLLAAHGPLPQARRPTKRTYQHMYEASSGAEITSVSKRSCHVAAMHAEGSPAAGGGVPTVAGSDPAAGPSQHAHGPMIPEENTANDLMWDPAAGLAQNARVPVLPQDNTADDLMWACTARGADEIDWERAAGRLELCCGRVWDARAFWHHVQTCKGTSEEDQSRAAQQHRAHPTDVILHAAYERGALLEDWVAMAGSLQRCCGRVWIPTVFARVHSPCPNASGLLD